MRNTLYDPADLPPDALLTVLGNANSFSGKTAAQIRSVVEGMRVQYVGTMEEIHRAIAAGGYGLLPLINFSSSPVDHNIRALQRIPNLRIVGDSTLEVKMAAIGTEECDPAGVRVVQSHEQGLLQCEDYTAFELPPGVERRQMPSTVAAVRDLAASRRHDTLALGAVDGIPEGSGLRVIRDRVSNAELIGEQNATGFAIGHANDRGPDMVEGKRRHLCIVTPANRKGMLRDLTGILADNGADMSMILSRPIGVQKYSFIVQFDHVGSDDDRVKDLGRIKNHLSGLPPLNDRVPVLQSLGSWNTSIWDPGLRDPGEEPYVHIPAHLR